MKPYQQRVIQGKHGFYFVEIRYDTETREDYEVEIYAGKTPTRKRFGVPVRKEPIIYDRKTKEIPVVTTVKKLIDDWELLLDHQLEFENWNGVIDYDGYIEPPKFHGDEDYKTTVTFSGDSRLYTLDELEKEEEDDEEAV